MSKQTFILATVKKDILKFPDNYSSQKEKDPFFDHLVYFLAKNQIVPEIIVVEIKDSLVVTKRGLYLEAANDIPQIDFVNVSIMKLSSNSIIPELEKNNFLFYRDAKELSRKDFSKSYESRWEIYRLQKKLRVEEEKLFLNQVKSFFSQWTDLNEDLIVESFNYNDNLFLVEFKVKLPKFESSFQETYKVFLFSLVEEFGGFLSINGKAFSISELG